MTYRYARRLTHSLTALLIFILVLSAARLFEPFWLNISALRVARAVFASSRLPGQLPSELSRQELEYARKLLADHRVTSSGATGLQALISHLADPPDVEVAILEELARTSGEIRPIVKLWLGDAYLEQREYQKALSVWAEIGAARQLLELGDELAAAGQWEEAVGAYEAGIERLGQDVRVYSGLGRALEQLGRQDDALEIYRRALTIAPRNYGVYVAIGNIYRDRGMFDEAQAWYDRAVQETGHVEWPYIASARVHEMQGALDLAEARLQAVLDENPGNCQAWGRMGRVLWKQSLYDEAITALEGAVGLCPQIPWLYQALGDARKDSGDMQGAVRAYEAALNMAPGNIYVREQLAHLRLMMSADECQ